MWRLKTARALIIFVSIWIALFLMQPAIQGALTPKIKITPNHALIDDNVKIVLQGFEKGQIVTVSASYTNSSGQILESHAEFLTDQRGRVNVATQTPISGTYQHADAMGLFWSMTPARDKKPVAGSTQNSLSPFNAQFDAIVKGQIVATATMQQWPATADVTRIPVHDQGLRGVLFLPSGKKPHPGVIFLGGSEGGLHEGPAAFLASKGYAVLTLAYFRYEDLPKSMENIPLEYFETAIDWLEARKEIRHDGIAVIGASRGTELALLLGSTFPQVRAVVAIAPSSVIWPGLGSPVDGSEPPAWIYKGQPLPFMSLRQLNPEQKKRIDQLLPTNPNTPVLWCQIQLENKAAVNNASIPVEKINGPILLISGNDDKLWPSTEMADMIMNRLKEANHGFPDAYIAYPNVGHNIPLPNMPVLIRLGGNPESMAAAAVDSWTHIVKFLNSAFGR
jgi:dienelactone hydrolase